MMSNYSRILAQFTKLGLNQNSHLNEYQINDSLDKIAQNNMNLTEFNRDVALELYEQTQKQYGGQIVVKDYIGVILTAHSVLERHIKDCNQKLKYAQNQTDRSSLQQSLQQFVEDYKLLTVPFKIKPALDTSSFNNNLVSKKLNDSNMSGIFSQQPSNRQQSTSLKIVFMIALLSFVLQMFMMFVKHHFLSMLTYLAILGIFMLNYFDKFYIRSCLILTVISVVLDFIWVIAEVDPYWNKDGPTQHSNLQPGFLRFTYIMTIILMIGKGLLAILLWRYRSNDEDVHKKVKLLNIRFDLDGKPKASPVNQLWTGDRAKSSLDPLY